MCFGADRMRLGPASKARIGVTCTSRALQRAAFSYRAHLPGCLSLPFALLLCLACCWLALAGSSSPSQECWSGEGRWALSVSQVRPLQHHPVRMPNLHREQLRNLQKALVIAWGLLAYDSFHPGPSCNGTTRFTRCCSPAFKV
jgi:hypothetical protein